MEQRKAAMNQNALKHKSDPKKDAKASSPPKKPAKKPVDSDNDFSDSDEIIED